MSDLQKVKFKIREILDQDKFISSAGGAIPSRCSLEKHKEYRDECLTDRFAHQVLHCGELLGIAKSEDMLNKHINKKGASSYGLKHVFERTSGEHNKSGYIHNGAVIFAARILGLKCEENKLNVDFNISQKGYKFFKECSIRHPYERKVV